MSFRKIKSKPERKARQTKEKNSNSMHSRDAAKNRHALRQAERGREIIEGRVKELLSKKIAAGELVSWEYFSPNSQEDRQGRDFRVTKMAEGKTVTIFFGVTISRESHLEHQAKHPETPSIWIPINMTDERIWHRICQLCQESDARASKPELNFYADFHARSKTNLKVSAISLLSIIMPTSLPLNVPMAILSP